MLRDRMPGRVTLYIVLGLFALFFLSPLYIVVATSLKSLEEIRQGTALSWPGEISFAAWSKAWSSACTGIDCRGLQPYFLNSVSIVVPSVILSSVIGSINGYALSQWRFRGSDLIFTLLLLGFFIPYQAIILPAAQFLGWLGIANSIPGLIVIHVGYGIAFTTMLFRNYYVSVPHELVRAARVDGASFATIYRRIILPLSAPVFVVCMIWQFTQIWNDFLFGVIFTGPDTRPVTVGLNNLVNTSEGAKEYNVDLAGALITALPTMIVYLLGGKYFVRGLTAGAVKG